LYSQCLGKEAVHPAQGLLLILGMKPNSDATGDRHTSSFMLRLPEIFRTKLLLLKEKTGKPMTALVQWGLKLLLRRFGLWNRQDEKELKRQQRAALADHRADGAT
jgi:hypothetical protein